jgi:hypothetical protein
VIKIYFRQDSVQTWCVVILGCLFLVNPIARVFGITDNSFDKVQVVQNNTAFLGCQKSSPESVSMGGVKKSAQTSQGVIAIYTNPSIENYHGFLCLTSIQTKIGKKTSTRLKPHPKLDVDELTAFQTVQLSTLPGSWQKEIPFSIIRTP